MNHSPFEDWLLNETSVTLDQQRELELHLRSCSYCSALAETGKMLHASKVVAPAAGFTARFQTRLAEHKLLERRRRLWGTLVFTLGGVALLMWILSPYVFSFAASPAAWLSSAVGWLVFLETTFVALFEAGSVIMNVIPKFLPPFVWMVVISALAGVSLLWSVSIWRLAQRGAPRGV